ncbi:hypothetical protein GEMRC1_000356 [Eukaryota sp. GEM-RC1]
MIELVTHPLQLIEITVLYSSQSVTLNLIANDCYSPKMNSGHGCLCPRGMEFNFLGECVKCPLNFYTNLELNSECRSCTFPRITLHNGTTHVDHCVCPLNTLDSHGACLPCPHLAECGYGNLTDIASGFRLNTDKYELVECVFWYNCEDNSCRTGYSFGDKCQYCTNDAVSKKFIVLEMNIHG